MEYMGKSVDETGWMDGWMHKQKGNRWKNGLSDELIGKFIQRDTLYVEVSICDYKNGWTEGGMVNWQEKGWLKSMVYQQRLEFM